MKVKIIFLDITQFLIVFSVTNESFTKHILNKIYNV